MGLICTSLLVYNSSLQEVGLRGVALTYIPADKSWPYSSNVG